MTLPRVIAGYRVLGRLARGRAVELFAARKRGGPIVCIKRLPPSFCDDVDLVARFDREMSTARQLRHPNIVAVHEHGEDDGHYFVMEHVNGTDLRRLIGQVGRLDPDLVAFFGAGVARAFVYLHHGDPRRSPRGPIVHCDVSPENVLIDRAGRVKLSDFGMARVLPKTGAETVTQSRGKLTYLSPEQWRGEKLGAKSDLFSLGLVLWQALVGTHPYAEGRPRHRLLHDWIGEGACTNRRRSVREAAPHAPRALQEVIEGLLQPAERRIGRAERVLSVLEAIAPRNGQRRLGLLVRSAARQPS
ncbi:MAG TPA: serine/threonine-protein kinase [Sandaracinaceae bacterium]